jgi:glutathione S-transferase
MKQAFFPSIIHRYLQLSFVDYTLFEFLDMLQLLDSNCLQSFPALKGFHERMNGRPHLQDYLKQRKLSKMLVNGNGKQ